MSFALQSRDTLVLAGTWALAWEAGKQTRDRKSLQNNCTEMVGGGNSVFWLALPLLHSLPQK